MRRSDRRTFLKQSAVGIAALGGAGACAPGGTGQGEARRQAVEGALTPSHANLGRFVMARTSLPIAAWDDTLAAARLASDIFANRASAERFFTDQQGYLSANGLAHVRLDPQSVEVKLARALGDPQARTLVENRDVAGFLGYLDSTGLLGEFQRSSLLRAGQNPTDLPCQVCDMSGVGGGFAFAVVAVVVAAVVTYVAVAYTVTVVMMVEAVAGLDTEVAVSGTSPIGDPAALYRKAPGLALAEALGGADSGREMAAGFRDETVETVARSLEESDVYRRLNGPVGAPLRALIRHHLGLMTGLPA